MSSKRLMGKKRFQEKLAERVFAYSLLSRFFIDEPNKEFIALLINNNLLATFPCPKSKGAQVIDFSLKDPQVLEPAFIDSLKGSYNNLLLGPSKKMAAPYESVYRNPKKLVFQEETMAVRQFYQKYGVLPEKFQQEPDDHIALELKFMQILAEKSYEAFKKNQFNKAKKLLLDQEKFLQEHLTKWVFDFVVQVRQNTDSDFFQGAALLLSEYLEFEQENLPLLIEQLKKRIAKEKEKQGLAAVK